MLLISLIKKFFKRIDIFGAKVELYVRKESAFKTVFSGLLTFLLFGFFFFLTLTKFWVLVTRSEIIQIETIRNSPSEGVFYLGNPLRKNTVMIALGLSNPSLNEYINISLLARSNIRNITSGVINKKKEPVSLEPCKPEHFPSLEQDFSILGLSSYLCPNLSSPLKIGGTYTDEHFDFFQIIVTDCSTTSKCKNSQESMDFSKKETQLDLSVFLTTEEIDPNDNDKPIKKKITSEIHFLLDNKFNSRLLKTADIFLRTLEINFDKEIFLPFPNNEVFNGVVFAAEVKEQLTTTDSKELGNFYIRKSPYIVEVERQFYTFGEFFSFLGGAWSQMFFLIYFVCSSYNKRRYLAKLANRIYKLDINEDPLRKSSSRMSDTKVEKADSKKKFSIDASSNQQPVEKGISANDIIKNIKQYLLKETSVKFSFLEIFFGFFIQFFRRRDKKLKVLQTSFESISEDLDLIKILKAQQDIEKLKRLLLNAQQLKLFDYSPKPNISLVGKNGKGKKLIKFIKSKHVFKVSPTFGSDATRKSKVLRRLTSMFFKNHNNLNSETSESIKELIFAYYQTKKRLQSLNIGNKSPQDEMDENLLNLIESDIKILKSIMNYSENEIFLSLNKEPSIMIPQNKLAEIGENNFKSLKCNFLVHETQKEK